MTTFSDFGLAGPILSALASEGYVAPTPIQLQAIAPVMAGRDLCGIAQTGTGKTAAFALPILHRLSRLPNRAAGGTCRALVLSPTRELASQIAESFRTYGKGLAVSIGVVYGGVPLPAQQRRLASGVDVLVATPGRLIDLVDRRAVRLDRVEIFVLDEADQMLDLGFIHALRRVAALLPRTRQSLFFSATMPKPIEALASTFLRDPLKVEVAPVATTAERVGQNVMFVSAGHKQVLLQTLLRDPAMTRSLVFTRTKHGANRVARQLASVGIDAAAIHGNKSQPQRERALEGFRSGRCRVLVATDIAARGIDVEGVSHVVNFDLPNVPECYVHRIGRTARAGASGTAISFCSEEEKGLLRDIEKLIRESIPSSPLPALSAALPRSAAPRAEEIVAGDRERPARYRAGKSARKGPNRPPRAARPPAGPRPSRSSSSPESAQTLSGLPMFLRRPPRGSAAGG